MAEHAEPVSKEARLMQIIDKLFYTCAVFAGVAVLAVLVYSGMLIFTAGHYGWLGLAASLVAMLVLCCLVGFLATVANRLNEKLAAGKRPAEMG